VRERDRNDFVSFQLKICTMEREFFEEKGCLLCNMMLRNRKNKVLCTS
jgi:hypothetical protein